MSDNLIKPNEAYVEKLIDFIGDELKLRGKEASASICISMFIAAHSYLSAMAGPETADKVVITYADSLKINKDHHSC